MNPKKTFERLLKQKQAADKKKFVKAVQCLLANYGQGLDEQTIAHLTELNKRIEEAISK